MEVGIGYHYVRNTFYEQEKCGLVEIDYLLAAYAWYPIVKFSPYKEMLKVK